MAMWNCFRENICW